MDRIFQYLNSECALLLVRYVFEPFHDGRLFTVVLILLRICLLICPMSLFAGLMSLQVGLFWKLSLWSFNVMYARFCAMRSALSCIFRSVAMHHASLFIM